MSTNFRQGGTRHQMVCKDAATNLTFLQNLNKYKLITDHWEGTFRGIEGPNSAFYRRITLPETKAVITIVYSKKYKMRENGLLERDNYDDHYVVKDLGAEALKSLDFKINWLAVDESCARLLTPEVQAEIMKLRGIEIKPAEDGTAEI